MGIVDHVIEAVLSIVPDKRFAALEIETTAAFFVKRVDCSTAFLQAQVPLPTGSDLAVSTSQIAAIGENQPEDERPGLSEKLVVDDVFQSIKEGVHGGYTFLCDKETSSF